MRPVFLLSVRGVAALAIAGALSGCVRQPDPTITGSISDDHAVRHPILVTQGMATLDFLPGGGPGGLTDRQVADISEFAGQWRAKGRGQIAIEIPKGGSTDVQSAHAAREIKTAILNAGVSPRAIVQTTYAANGPTHLAPVRLSYPMLEAGVPHDCGQWPDDLGYGGPGTPAENRQYWNFGCAQQQNMAAMVEDPEDFIRPRAEAPASATRRTTVIGKYQRGEPTVTTYPKDNVSTQDDN